MSISKISRKDEIENLYNICTRLYENTKDKKLDDDSFKNIISLNGGYGSGKTVFLKDFEDYVEDKYKYTNKKTQIVKLNIWEDDFADDPLIPILHSIAEHEVFKSLQYDLSFCIAVVKGGFHLVNFALETFDIDIKDNIQEFFNFFIEKGFFKNLKKITDIKEHYEKYIEKQETPNKKVDKNLKKIDPEFFIKKQVIKLIKQSLHDTVKETDKPFFILVDELDRCRPDYAVTTLERIKHIFNVAGLIFILAVDRKQLEHSVRHAFGAEWDFDNYYLRFAPIEISLGSVFDKIHGNTWGVNFMDIQPYFNDLSTIIPNFLREINCTLRILVMTKEKIELLGLPDSLLLTVLCLTTKNPYRDAFYELFVTCNVNSPKIPAGLTKLIMFFKKQDQKSNQTNLDDINLFTTTCLRLFINLNTNSNISNTSVDNFKKNWNSNNLSGNLEKFIHDFIVFLGENKVFNLCKQHQPILKALFEHYKPIEKE